MRYRFLAFVLFGVLVLSGCGSGDTVITISPSPFVASILSDPLLDGDIEVSGGTTTIRQGNPQSVFVGIDPLTFSETRAFLDFSLAAIPANAIIDSASLDFVVDSIQPSFAAVQILIDLISFPQPLLAADFGSAFLATAATPLLSLADVGNHVTVNVTTLMQEAQRRGSSHFQVRMLRGAGAVPSGLVEINDTTGINRAARAPQLTVIYF